MKPTLVTARQENRQFRHIRHPDLAAIGGRAEWDRQSQTVQPGNQSCTGGVESIVVRDHFIGQ